MMSSSSYESPPPSPGPRTHNMNNNPTESSLGAEIKPEAITYHPERDRIGNGSYGTVYRAKCSDHVVAVKILKQQLLSEADMKTFRAEVHHMSVNSHPNIIRLMGACTVPGSLQIVTELCSGGDLEQLLRDESYKGSLYDTVKMARDTAKGMTWLHEVTKIIHGDLKPANLLIDSNGQIKITDFGFSQIKQDYPIETSTVKGTLMWMAPEKIQRKPYTEKIDVFSFGIILWEMITRRRPYEHHTVPLTFCQAVCYDKERPPFSSEFPPALRELISACWRDDPTQRPTFKEILAHLNVMLVDCAIEMPVAASFWKAKFLHRETFEYVEWVTFRQALKEVLGNFEDSFFENIKKYLVETIKEGQRLLEFVTMKKFDKVTKWFGPFILPQLGPATIKEVNHLSEQKWFHGDITAEVANTCISNEKSKGAFIIRLSSANPLRAPFTLSRPKNNHTHIQRTEAGLLAFNEVYPTLDAFVAKNSSVLTTPCEKNYAARYPEGSLTLR